MLRIGKLILRLPRKINEIFIEIVIAPSYSEKALEILTGKKNIRVLELPTIGERVKKMLLI